MFSKPLVQLGDLPRGLIRKASENRLVRQRFVLVAQRSCGRPHLFLATELLQLPATTNQPPIICWLMAAD